MERKGDTKVVLVTGASGGIGEAVAIQYAKLNYLVAITGRNQERLDKVLEKLASVSGNKSQGAFLAIQVDFENPDAADLVIEQTVKQFGRIDILVNNAGFPGQKRPLEHKEFYQDFQRVLQVNLMAPMRLSQLAAEHLISSKGVIINVSSIADRLAMPNISYSVSKAGLSMLTKTLANALSGTGVRVVGVSPGPVRSNFVEGIEALNHMSSLERVGEPDEVADLIVFLSSAKAGYITGSTVDIDGGIYAKLGDSFTQLREDFLSKDVKG